MVESSQMFIFTLKSFTDYWLIIALLVGSAILCTNSIIRLPKPISLPKTFTC